MAAPYDARRIANLLLDKFDSREFCITNKKINKVLYYIHAFALIRLRISLIKNHIEAWDHGPVIAVVYHAFKNFEFRPIEGRAAAFDYLDNSENVLSYDELSPDHAEFIVRIATHYMKFSADELEDMSHRVGGPWDTVRSMSQRDRGIRNRIPDQLILEHFSARFGEQQSAN